MLNLQVLMKKHISKLLQNDDKIVKNNEKKRKKIDKTLIISVSIPIVIALFVVLFITIPDPLRAALQLKRIDGFVSKGDAVVFQEFTLAAVVFGGALLVVLLLGILRKRGERNES